PVRLLDLCGLFLLFVHGLVQLLLVGIPPLSIGGHCQRREDRSNCKKPHFIPPLRESRRPDGNGAIVGAIGQKRPAQSFCRPPPAPRNRLTASTVRAGPSSSSGA